MYKSNKFCDILEINKGITAIIGSGGKTSLMMRLAEELCERGRTVIGTTTHIMRPEGIPVVETEEELEKALRQQDESRRKTPGQKDGHMSEQCIRPLPVCIGSPAEDPAKLSVSEVPFDKLVQTAEYVIAEADGARRMPLKCHAAHEPVIPETADKVIWVIGLSGIGKKVSEAVHRPELFKEYTGLGPEDTVTAAAAAKAIAAEAGKTMEAAADTQGSSRKLAIFINQADSEEDNTAVLELEKELKNAFEAEGRTSGIRIYAGSVKNGRIRLTE